MVSSSDGENSIGDRGSFRKLHAPCPLKSAEVWSFYLTAFEFPDVACDHYSLLQSAIAHPYHNRIHAQAPSVVGERQVMQARRMLRGESV